MSTLITVTAGNQVSKETQVSIGHLGDPDPRGYQHLLVPRWLGFHKDSGYLSVLRDDTFLGEPE